MQPITTLTPTRNFPRWVPLLIAALLIIADQALKAWANANLQPGQPVQPFIPGLISWYLTYNTGAAWSLFSGGATVLAIGRLIVGVGILGYLMWRPQGRFMDTVLAMIAAGAIGNTIDGLRFGKVTDMLYSPALSAVTRAFKAGDFPVFNIADCCIVLGVLLMIVSSLLPKRHSAPPTA